MPPGHAILLVSVLVSLLLCGGIALGFWRASSRQQDFIVTINPAQQALDRIMIVIVYAALTVGFAAAPYLILHFGA